MKKYFKKIVVSIITWQAKRVIKKYNPKIIAITGSVGKTSTKDAIFTVLSKFKNVRKSEKSFNSEIGLPLTILGLPNGWDDPFIWIENIFYGFLLIIKKQKYPEYLVLEIGVGKPGDIKKNVTPWLRPDIVIITRFPDKPVHVEFFGSVEKIIEEKSALVYALKKDGILILNHDDDKVYALHLKSAAKTVSFGNNENSTYKTIHPTYLSKKENGLNIPAGINFKLIYGGNTFPVMLPNIIGFHNIGQASAALACAHELGCDLLESIKALNEYVTPHGRLSLIQGINNSFIIDDTYNSSPVAMDSAIEVLRDIEGKRKIAVLGDMLELGKFTKEEHFLVGEKINGIANILITVGPRAKFIAEGAISKGFEEKEIYSFDSSKTAAKFLECMVLEGDLVLVKGSQGVRLEKVVESIMKDKELKNNLLCRQDKEWKNR
jgi:UDP-N-acetylmuramoyl-tripeptide--D-alanyl-D-alanine ligase